MIKSDLVLPLGLALGPRPTASEPVFAVRIGWHDHLLDAESAALWRICHGAWSASGSGWDRHDVIESALADGIEAPSPVLDELHRQGMIVHLERPVLEDEAFLRDHCLAPLMTGLGRPDRSEPTMAMGVIGEPALAQISLADYAIWCESPHAPHLAQLATTIQRAEYLDAREMILNEEQAREALIASVQVLISRGVAFLDQVVPPVPPDWNSDADDVIDGPHL